MMMYVSSSIFSYFNSEERNINLEAMMGTQEAANPIRSSVKMEEEEHCPLSRPGGRVVLSWLSVVSLEARTLQEHSGNLRIQLSGRCPSRGHSERAKRRIGG